MPPQGEVELVVMGKTDNVLIEALALPDEDRAEVAHRLLDSIESVDPHAHLTDEALALELSRRASEAVGDPSSGSSWDEARSRISKKLTQK